MISAHPWASISSGDTRAVTLVLPKRRVHLAEQLHFRSPATHSQRLLIVMMCVCFLMCLSCDFREQEETLFPTEDLPRGTCE